MARPVARFEVPFEPPLVTWPVGDPAPRYYDWRETLPFLRVMLDNRAAIEAELAATATWHDWPEHNLYNPAGGDLWRVFPFCYTIPANDPSRTTWVDRSCEACPFTASLLASLPGIRTALFSRLGPHTTLTAHQGWADLSNFVLRCHLPLVVPPGELCGMAVEGEVKHHEVGDILVFDDSKMHLAFNDSDALRTILLFDIARPDECPVGRAAGSTTAELASFIDYFK